MVTRSRLSALVGSAAWIAACSSSDPAAPTSGSPDAGAIECAEGTPGCFGWVACPPEFEKDEAGGCREILPDGDCPAGTMPALGRRDCAPVGTTKCASGFERDPSGWGCRAVLPEKSCTGATRDAIGSSTCVPVGDCSAAFPPAGALVVSSAFADADLGPTKFRTIASAVAAAKSGDVVAIESGEYDEGIVAKSGVTVVGRCAEKVRLVGTGLEVHGVLANGTKGVVVRGLTLVDHYEGARAQGGATLTLEDVVIETPRFTGLIAWRSGSSIRAEHVVVRQVRPHADQTAPVFSINADEGGTVELVESSVTDSWEAGLVGTNPGSSTTPSTLELTRCVVRDTNVVEHSVAGAGITVSDNSRAEVRESAILNVRGASAIAIAKASLSITSSEIRGTLEGSSPETVAGVYAEGGKITLTDVSIHDAVQSGLFARSKGALAATNTVVHGTKPGKAGVFGMGAWGDTGATLRLESTALVDNAYYGVAVLDSPATATLKNVLVRGTAAQKSAEGGLGRGINVEDGATVDLDGVSVVANDGEGLFVRGEKDGKRARATAKGLLVDAGRTAFGTGVFVAKGALAEIDGAVIRDMRRSGIVVNETLGDKGSRSEGSFTHVVVRGTKPIDSTSTDPKTIALDGIGIGSAGKLTLRSSAVVDNVQFGIIVGNSGETTIESVVIGATRPSKSGAFGHGLVAYEQSSLVLHATDVHSNDVGLFFAGTRGVVSGSRVRANAIGIHTQGGTTLATGAEAPETPDEGVVFVTDDSQFVDNSTRVSADDLPIPGDPFAAK